MAQSVTQRTWSGEPWLRVASVLLDILIEAWSTRPFPVPDLDELPATLRDQLRAYSRLMDERLPPEAVYVYATSWTRLYGLLCLEVLHQMDFILTDMESLFEQCLDELAMTLGPTTGP